MDSNFSPAVLFGGICGMVGGYLGYMHGPSHIGRVGATLLGLLIGIALGLNMIATLFPRSYIELFEKMGADGAPFIALTPLVSVFVAVIVIDPPRIQSIINFDYSFWMDFIIVAISFGAFAVLRLIVYSVLNRD